MSAIPILRDIAVVLLAIEIFVVMLVPVVITYFAVRGVSWLQRQLRTYAPPVQGGFRKAASVAEQVSQKIAEPFIVTSAGVTQARHVRSTLATSWSTLLTKEV